MENSRFCTRCGASVALQDTFCGKCGTPLRVGDQDPAQPLSATPGAGTQAPTSKQSIPAIVSRKGYVGRGLLTVAAIVVGLIALAALTGPNSGFFVPLTVILGVVGSVFMAVHGFNRLLLGYKYGPVILLGVALLFVGALWYFLVYDTAEGKCNRGDIGACVVWQSEQGR